MGGGSFDHDRFTIAKKARVAANIDDFDYSSTATEVHENLDPKRINKKPFGKLESRDSVEHPESNAVFVCFDVTGSNIANAREAQKKLPNLMALLTKYISDPQVLMAANDDIYVEQEKVVQISDFESDNRVDEHLRNIILVGNGGGNDMESYDLLMYAAARKTVLDCFEKRGRKGYFFMYADEPLYPEVSKKAVASVYGDKIQKDIPIVELIEDLRKTYHVFVIWPGGSSHGYTHAREQYVKLFGEESVLTLQHPNLICELIGAAIGLNEDKVSEDDVVKDLVSVGKLSKSDAKGVTDALVPLTKGIAKSSGALSKSGKGSAVRL